MPRLSPIKSPIRHGAGVHVKDMECTLLFPSAVPRAASAAFLWVAHTVLLATICDCGTSWAFHYMSRLMTKPTKWQVRAAKTQISLIRVFAVRIKKAWVLSYPLSAQRKLIRLGCPADLSLRGRKVILLVLS